MLSTESAKFFSSKVRTLRIFRKVELPLTFKFFYLLCSRAYEQAGLIAGKDMEKWQDASSFFEKSCQLFREHGVPDTAALTYDRGAK